jgi:hypothetical protein
VNGEEGKTTKDATNDPPRWDPIETVRIIMNEAGCSNHNSRANNAKDVEKEDSAQGSNTKADVVSTSPPGYRFILRMIPIQTTVSDSHAFTSVMFRCKYCIK